MGYSEKCKKFAKRLGVELSASVDKFCADVAEAMGLDSEPGECLTLEMIEEMAVCEGDGVMNNPDKRPPVPEELRPEGIACNQEEDVSVEPFAASVAELLERMSAE